MFNAVTLNVFPHYYPLFCFFALITLLQKCQSNITQLYPLLIPRYYLVIILVIAWYYSVIILFIIKLLSHYFHVITEL